MDGFHPRPQPRQDRACTPRTRASSSSETSRSPSRTCSEKRTAASTTLMAESRSRSASRSRSPPSPATGQLLEHDDRVRAESDSIRAADRAVPEHTLRARRARDGDQVAQVFVDRCLDAAARPRAHTRGRGDGEVVDDRAPEQDRRPLPPAARRLRLHERVLVAQAWRDARSQTIYGGTNEIMKEIVAKSLGLRDE